MEISNTRIVVYSVIVILTVALVGFLTLSTVRLGTEKLDLATELRLTQQDLRDRKEENKDLFYIRDLAIEFGMTPSTVLLIDHYAREVCCDNDLTFRLVQSHQFLTFVVLSLVYAESKGDYSAVGDGGKALGLGQIWLSTAKEYEPEITRGELLTPEANVRILFAHLIHLLEEFNGNIALALYAYNRGESKVDRLIALGQSPENSYGYRVYNASLESNGGNF